MEKKDYNNWYILFVRGGHEKQIIDNIHNSLKNYQLSEQVAEIRILEGVNKSGKLKNLLSSYLFVNCIMNSDLLVAFYSVRGVISFLNHNKNDFSKNPPALSTLEVNNFLFIGRRKGAGLTSQPRKQEQFGTKKFLNKSTFEMGNLILIKEGFFKNHRGAVTKVDLRKEMVTINIDFFGRLTPVSIKFAECEKI